MSIFIMLYQPTESYMRKNFFSFVMTATILSCGVTLPSAMATTGVDSSELRDAITLENLESTLQLFEKNGARVPGSVEYDIGAEYIRDALMDLGYDVTYQYFNFEFWEELTDPLFNQLDPNFTEYIPYELEGFATMEYSGKGDVQEEIVKADNFGCDPVDFQAYDFTEKIALIERGECTFVQKAQNAEAANAAAVIVYNDDARQDAFQGTLGGPGITVPVVGTSFAIGQELQQTQPVTARVIVDAHVNVIRAYNLLAETPGGRDDRVVVVGAHLDGVDGTTAINDNGSGSAAIFEIARQMAALGIEPVNKIRFAFWTAEESGLVGSEYYVANLTEKEKKDIALNLNFDMLGSPNFVRLIYDGDGSTFEESGPNGSGNIEMVFADYFTIEGIPFEETAFDGRSDYGPFIEAGIPAGGLFTGADDVKTEEQAMTYGGVAGELLDPNYHTPADNISNIDLIVFEEMTDAAAHAVLTFGMTSSAVNGTGKSSPVAQGKMLYKGPKVQQ